MSTEIRMLDDYPNSLKEYILTGGRKDVNFEYEPIEPTFESSGLPFGAQKVKYMKSMHLPKRIDSPLQPWPKEIRSFFNQDSLFCNFPLHADLAPQYMALQSDLVELRKGDYFRNKKISFEIDDLKKLSLMTWSDSSASNDYTSIHCALKMSNYDIGIITGNKSEMYHSIKTNMSVPSFLSYCLRFRALTNREVRSATYTDINDLYANDSENMVYTHNQNLIYVNKTKNTKSMMIQNSSVFALYNSDSDFIWIGPSEYMDYALTYCEVLMNMSIMSIIREYDWMRELIIEMDKMLRSCVKHNHYVNFMKTYESICLLMSDFKGSDLLNWTPIIDGLTTLLDESVAIDGYSSPIEMVILYFIGVRKDKKSKSLLIRILSILSGMDGTQLQEVSALHKSAWFSEIDYVKGIRKYLRRVHTLRPADPLAVKELVWMTKKEFFFSYHSKHGFVPNMIKPIEKVQEILSHEKSGSINQLKLKELSWWDDLIIWSCMDNTQTSDPLEYAKDKGALKEQIRFGPGDSERELLQLLKAKPYEVGSLDLSAMETSKQRSIWYTHKANVYSLPRFPTKLCMKEREQKSEGRLFGVGTIKMKHDMSSMMVKAKKVLSYFEGELMTVSDKDRKLMLHESAQELNRDDTFSILLDIEGHNQSMQPHNTEEMIEFIGNLYGESGWGNLSRYFSNLTVYYYDPYLDKCIVSEGQNGGIEGWMNPIWTLHTLMGIKRSVKVESMDVSRFLVYSDDVQFLVRIYEKSELTVSRLFDRIQKRMMEIGMICKMSQTAITKTRATILRKHYYKGIQADSTAKKLISCSMFTGDSFDSEEIRVDGITSSTTSAMEMTNHPNGVNFFKWVKIVYCTLRLFCQIFDYKHEDSLLARENLPIDWKKMICLPIELSRTISDKMGGDFKNIDDKAIMMILREHLTKEEAVDVKVIVRHLYGESIEDFQRIRMKDMVSYLLTRDDSFVYLYYTILCLPSRFGGFGVQLLINQSLTGHGDSTHRQAYYLEEGLKYISNNQSYIKRVIRNSIIVGTDIVQKSQGIISSTTKWVSPCHHESSDKIIQKEVSAYMRSECTNSSIVKLFQVDDERSTFVSTLADFMRKRLNYRVLQFFFENSVYYVMDLLLSKVDNSTGLSSKIRSKKKVRSKIFRTLVERRLDIFRNASKTNNVEVMSIGLLDLLMEQRSKMYPAYVFDTIDEPLYDHMMKPTIMRDADIWVAPSPVSYTDDTHERFLTPPISGSVLYKGEYIGPAGMYQSIESFLTLRLVSVTKWMIMLSGLNPRDDELVKNHQYYVACNHSLSTLTTTPFKDLVNCAPDTVRGEIRHRIPNSRFVSACSIKILPNIINSEMTHINQKSVYIGSLEDTNINFDYLRHRLQLKHAYQRYCDMKLQIYYLYKLDCDHTVADVRIDTEHDTYDGEVKLMKPVVYYRAKETDIRYINALSVGFSQSEGVIMQVPNTEHFKDVDFEQISRRIRQEAVVSYYKMQVKAGTIYDIDESTAYLWDSFIKRYKLIDPKIESMMNEERVTYLKGIIVEWGREEREIFMKKGVFIDKQIIIDLLEDDIPNIVEGVRIIQTEMANLSEVFSKLIKDDDKLVIGPLMNVTIDNFNGLLGKHCKAAIIWVIVNYTLKLAIKNGKYEIDYAATLEHLYLLLTYPIVSTQELMPITILKLVMGQKRLIDNARRIGSDFIKKIGEKIQLAINVDTYDGGIFDAVKPIKHDFSINVSDIIPKDIRCRIVEINHGILSNAAQLSRIQNSIRQIVEMYSDPTVYNSPTGSDSLVGQYYLFDCLFSEGICTKEMKICDLTAGRGDGSIALSQFTDNVDSYATLDIFTKSVIQKDIITSVPYNLFDPDTCIFCNSYDWIHIDISYLGHEKERLRPFFSFMLNMNKPFSIRMNSLSFEYSSEYLEELSNTHKVMMVYPITKGHLWYQVYLVYLPMMNSIFKKVKEPIDDPGVKEMMEIYQSQVNHRALFSKSSGKIVNSTTFSIGKSLTVGKIEDSFEMGEKLKIANEIHNMGIDFQIVISGLPFPESYREELFEYLKNIGYDEMQLSRKIDQNISYVANHIELIGYNEQDALTTNRGKKLWREKMKERVRSFVKEGRTRQRIEWFRCPQEAREWFMRTYPKSKYRKIMIQTEKAFELGAAITEEILFKRVIDMRSEYLEQTSLTQGLKRKITECSRYLYMYISHYRYEDVIGLIIIESRAASMKPHQIIRLVNTFKRVVGYLDDLIEEGEYGVLDIDYVGIRKKLSETSPVIYTIRKGKNATTGNMIDYMTEDDRAMKVKMEKLIESIKFDDIKLDVVPPLTIEVSMDAFDKRIGNKQDDRTISSIEENMKSFVSAFDIGSLLDQFRLATEDEDLARQMREEVYNDTSFVMNYDEDW